MMNKKFGTTLRVVSVAAGLTITSAVYSQENVSYTESQAAAGQLTYEERCATCHGYNLEGFELAPSLSGNLFSRRFGCLLYTSPSPRDS